MASCAEVIGRSSAQFGTSGVRGLVEDLDDATCFAFTYGFLQHLKHNLGLTAGQTVWVGMDLRPSSPQMARACLAAIAEAQCEAVFCGVVPTPALAHSALAAGSPAVMITGSHIPFDRNGIKFYRADGEMLKADEAPIVACASRFPDELFDGGALIETAALPQADARAQSRWRARYVSAFEGMLAGMTVGHYQHSAAGRDLLCDLLEKLGAKVVPLARSESFVPIDTEAVSQSDQEQAKTWVREHQLDALISTDGDGDRPLLADEKGTYFRGDTLGILAARALAADCVVTPVSSNGALELSNWFDKTVRTKIGSPHVIAAMQHADRPGSRVVGFEANGGFLTQNNLVSVWNGIEISALPTRDSVLPVLATLAMAQKMKMALSELPALLPGRVTASDRLEHIERHRSLALIEELVRTPARCSVLNRTGEKLVGQDHTDGLRLNFANGDVVHIRPSGNAPELRIYVESGDANTADKLLSHAKNSIGAMI